MSHYTLPKPRRLKILERDGWKCVYCGQPLTYDLIPSPYGDGAYVSPKGYQYPTMDHVHPRSQGGKHGMDNVVAACGKCNSRKQAKPAEQFKESRK